MVRSHFLLTLIVAGLFAPRCQGYNIVTPGPPPDPENYMHIAVDWSFSPPPLVTVTGSVTNTVQLVNDSFWYPRNTINNPALGFLLEDPNVAGAEGFGVRVGPELDAGLPEFNLHLGEILSSEDHGNFLVTDRRLTFTAPGGYFRQTPEPSALAMIATAAVGLGAIRRSR
jgi:hypothetical protein